MSDKLSIAKEAAIVVAKSKGLDNPKVNVILCLDYSGSMDEMYTSGFVQEVVERIVPLAMAFTPSKEMPLYIFHNSCIRVLPDVTESNVKGYVRNNIMKNSYGGTEYSTAVRMILNNVIKENGTASGDTLLGKAGKGIAAFFGAGPKKVDIPVTTGEVPTLVLFITDGDDEDGDKQKCTAAIIEAAKHSLFFQFIGLQHRRSQDFRFLKKLDELPGRFIDNANFFPLSDESFRNLADEQLYALMMTEFPSWYKEAQTKGLFKEAAKEVTT